VRAERLLAALLLALAAPAGADELGTLFHTAEERARLDRMRRGETLERVVTPGRTDAPEVTGFVKRSDGRNTVWIDGRAVPTSSARAAPLFDPRIVRDLATDLPPSSVRVYPEGKLPPRR
jgi:hypothetical protein